MCTVSFFPMQKGFVLTSNRDESPCRETLFPDLYMVDKNTVICPKDKVQGGSWIAHDQNGRSACLLNGGFKKHKRSINYIKSRGLILLDVFSYNTNLDFIDNIDLKGVEPFTLILIEPNNNIELITFIWDGERKHFEFLNPVVPHLWSSATLYEKNIHSHRLSTFLSWVDQIQQIDFLALLNFHKCKFLLNADTDCKLTTIQTVSITQIINTLENTKMDYYTVNTFNNNSYSLDYYSLNQ